MELEFFGAAGEVTGSCHILRVGDQTVLLDCGMIQGGRKSEERNRDPFPFDPAQIDAVILSHAHIDHSGRLPLLVKRGYRGHIHTQNASRDLCRVLLLDSASLQENDAERQNRRRQRQGKGRVKPLYTVNDAEAAIRQLRGVRYHDRFDVCPGVQARFVDAGHILGSASVEVFVREGSRERKIVFSGDLGQYDTPILKDPEAIHEADLVIIESTYGGRKHRSRDATIEELGGIIKSAQNTGNIMIPAFAVGRSQEILYQFGKHYDQWDMDRWNIFLDSPMAIEASEIYWDYPHLYDDEATRLRRETNQMPPLPNLHLSKSTAESMAINRIKKGAIIVAGSGMCNGGRILHHFKHNLWNRNNHVVIVGYQAYGSLGRRLVDGEEFVRIHGEDVRVGAKIHTIGGLSAHGDEDDLVRWYSSIANRPDVYIVHGDPDRSQELGARLEREFRCRTRLAEPGLKVTID